MPECVLQKTCVAYKNWHCGNFLQENCQPINNCGPAQETVPDCSYLFLFFEILYSRQHFLLEPDLKKFVWDIYIDRFFRSTSKIVEWEKKKRAKRTKNVLQCPMC